MFHPPLTEPVLDLCHTCYSDVSKRKVPSLSIAAGVDYVNYNRLALPRLSLLEKAVLARNRVYAATIKCTSLAKTDANMQLSGHVISVPHDAIAMLSRQLPEIIAEVVKEVTVTFLGSKELLRHAFQANKLSRYLRVNVSNLVQWLAVLSDASIRSDYDKFRTPAFTAAVETYRRLQFQPVTEAVDNSAEAAATALSADDRQLLADLPQQIINGALTTDTNAETEFANIIDIVAADDIAHVRDNQDCDDAIDAACIAPRESELAAQHSEEAIYAALALHILNIGHEKELQLINEFANNRDLLSGAFPWIFILGADATLKKEGPLSAAAKRHLFLQSNNQAAEDANLLFLIANQTMRHAACLSTSCRVRSDPQHILEFGELMSDPAFVATIKAAVDGEEKGAEDCQKKAVAIADHDWQ